MTCTSINSVSDNITSLRDRLSSVAINTLSEIIIDRAKRIEGYKKEKNLLNGGIWYDNEYFKILKEEKYMDRLNFFRKKGSFFHGYISKDHFKMIEDPTEPTGLLSHYYKIKETCKPSESLKALRNGISFLGCGEACEVGYVEAFKEVLGTDKFDSCFSANSPTPLTINFNFKYKTPFRANLIKETTNEKLKKGEIVYISNSKLYHIKHINGDGAGFFCICSDDTFKNEKFISLGLPLNATTDNINETLIQEFNKDPIDEDIIEKEIAQKIFSTYTQNVLSLSQQLQHRQITKKDFFSQGGGRIIGKFDFNIKKISRLINGSEEKKIKEIK